MVPQTPLTHTAFEVEELTEPSTKTNRYLILCKNQMHYHLKFSQMTLARLMITLKLQLQTCLWILLSFGKKIKKVIKFIKARRTS